MEENQAVRKASGSRSLWVASQMPFGKKASNSNLHRKTATVLGGWGLVAEMKRAETAAQADPNWNLLKVHTLEAAYTFLTYSEFDDDPQPGGLKRPRLV